ALNSLGMDAAIIGRKEISEIELSTLFWIKLGIGVLSALALIALAEPISRFYRQPALTPITRVVALLFVTSALYQIHRSLLRRSVNFDAVASLTVISVLVGGAAAIIAAWRGWGAWSLVIQLIAQDLASIILFWWVSP